MLIAQNRTQQVVAAICVPLFALAIECGQYRFVGLDQMEWWDVRDDSLASLGMLCIADWHVLRRLMADRRDQDAI